MKRRAKIYAAIIIVLVLLFNSVYAFASEFTNVGVIDGELLNSETDSTCYITCDSDNNIYVVDRNNCRIQKFSNSGRFLGKWGTNNGVPASSNPLDNWGIGDGELFLPVGIACYGTDVYVTDALLNRVTIFEKR